MQNRGSFVISLDFELMWGVRDTATKESYGKNILGVHTALPKIIDLFKKYDIRGTFATVGFLFCKDKEEMISHFPDKKPEYTKADLSPYIDYMNHVGQNEKDDPYHYGFSLFEMIKALPEQELASHTFSHYYCLEEGQTAETFKSDLISGIKIAEKRNIKLSSIVFPRNQTNENYLELCGEMGIKCYRGNEKMWIYHPRKGVQENIIIRILRLIDSYINISGHNCYSDAYMGSAFPFNIPSSRFLRPYSNKIAFFDFLRLRRIKASMSYAAKNNLTYHLWWHPHNFGINQEKNIGFLEQILKHYKYLNSKYNFKSVTMAEKADELENKK